MDIAHTLTRSHSWTGLTCLSIHSCSNRSPNHSHVHFYVQFKCYFLLFWAQNHTKLYAQHRIYRALIRIYDNRNLEWTVFSPSSFESVSYYSILIYGGKKNLIINISLLTEKKCIALHSRKKMQLKIMYNFCSTTFKSWTKWRKNKLVFRMAIESTFSTFYDIKRKIDGTK